MHKNIIRTTIATGVVEGFTHKGVHRWRSIPYAQPPVGPLRFRAPRPAEPWSGVRPCHAFTDCAPQRRRYTMLRPGKYQPRSEDCLSLNVVAPAAVGPEALPVMVFVHGGALFMGSSATPLYDGAALARRGCVYVSVNYRLGALGCLDLSSLSTPDATLESNLHLRDVVLALRWVHGNIAAFGGDPDNVTVFGQSAGAHIVATLLGVPAAKGLFTRAISESPGGMVRSPDMAAEFAARFAALLGARKSDAAQVLMQASATELVATQNLLIDESVRNLLSATPFGPTCGVDFLPLDPLEAMRCGAAHRVPLVVGTTADEGQLFSRFLDVLPMVEALLGEMEPRKRERITAAYPGYPDPAASVRLGGDLAFSSTVWQIAETHGRHAPVYVYRYDYAPRMLRRLGLGATHSTELLAVFDTYRTAFGALLTGPGHRRTALRISNEVQNRWRSFSRTGIPGDDWPAYTDADRAVLVFDRRCRVEFDPHRDRRTAWEDAR